MIEKFEYTIKDPNGLHARPAGLLVKRVQEMGGEVIMECRGKSANLKKLLAVMGLGVRCGDTVIVTLEGDKCKKEAIELKTFFEDNF